MSTRNQIDQYLVASITTKEAVRNNAELLKNLETAIQMISDCFASGGKLLIAGNGGSAADAQHFAAEFVGRYLRERKARPAIALTANSSTVTAWSNDYSFDDVFARQIEAFGKSEDVFIGISTSGNSKNIIAAVRKAKALKLKTICFLGKDGGATKGLADLDLIVPSNRTSHIQEAHITLIHCLCEEVEKTFAE